jgi:hypothetical protein
MVHSHQISRNSHRPIEISALYCSQYGVSTVLLLPNTHIDNDNEFDAISKNDNILHIMEM